MRCAAWLVVAMVVASCTGANPRSCRDGLCTDQRYPFCDVDGAFEGTPQTCITVTCSPGQPVGCRGDTSLVCNPAGNNYDLVECPRGCDSTTGCRECYDNAQCSGMTPICSASGTCRACAHDDECESKVCDAGACVPASEILYAAPAASGTSCSFERPCTMSTAVTLARGAAIAPLIRLLPGIYAEGLVFDGSTSAPLRVVGTGATITAAIGVSATNGGSAELRGGSFAATNIAVRCGDTGQAGSRLVLRGVSLFAAAEQTYLARVEECELTLEQSDLQLNASPNAAVLVTTGGSFRGDRLHMRGTADDLLFQEGISAFGSRMDIQLTNSVLDRLGVGVQATDSGPPNSYAAFGYNTITLRRASSVVCDAGFGPMYRTMVLDNNIVLGNETLDVVQGNECVLRNNVLFPSSPRSGNIIGDPRFADTANRDYHLAADSPAIDAAMATTAFPTFTPDLDGVARPQGAAADIGAYERSP